MSVKVTVTYTAAVAPSGSGTGAATEGHAGFAFAAGLGVAAGADGRQLGEEVVAGDGAAVSAGAVVELVEELAPFVVGHLGGQGLAGAEMQGQRGPGRRHPVPALTGGPAEPGLPRR
jgi:hypothetical protein